MEIELLGKIMKGRGEWYSTKCRMRKTWITLSETEIHRGGTNHVLSKAWVRHDTIGRESARGVRGYMNRIKVTKRYTCQFITAVFNKSFDYCEHYIIANNPFSSDTYLIFTHKGHSTWLETVRCYHSFGGIVLKTEIQLPAP